MTKIKIGIIDDHQAVARGVSAELTNTGMCDVIFIVSERTEIVAALEKELPDVLIMDVVMPGSEGINSFKEVVQLHPDLKIIAYTALNSPMMIELLLRAGVKGYVSKNESLGALREAIETVFHERISLPDDYHFLFKKIKQKEAPEELSKREIEILNLIASEKKTQEIAEVLQISVNTVETHRKHLFEKLGVSNLAGLIKAGIDQGYLK